MIQKIGSCGGERFASATLAYQEKPLEIKKYRSIIRTARQLHIKSRRDHLLLNSYCCFIRGNSSFVMKRDAVLGIQGAHSCRKILRVVIPFLDVKLLKFVVDYFYFAKDLLAHFNRCSHYSTVQWRRQRKARGLQPLLEHASPPSEGKK